MERGDTKDKGSGETCQCQREHERRPVDRSAITGHANPSQTETAQKPNSQTIRYWDRFHEFLPATQSVTNVLIMVFTGCLAFLGYVTERPQLAVHPTPLEHFVKGGTPRVIVVFENVGHQAANSVESGIAIAVFPYPLGDIHLTEVPPHGFPIDIFPSGPIGVPAAFQQPLSDADYNAVLDGKTWQIYVWGTVKYRDFFHISHSENFCYAFGGPDVSQAGICSVERPQQFYIAEKRGTQEPHAQPMPMPVPVGSP